MSTPDRDQEFEAFLERRSLLPRALAEHENAEPPPEVDRSVLHEARAAVSAAQARKGLRSNRWTVPVALAATVLLCLAIVVKVQRPPADTVTASRMEQRAATRAFEPVTPQPQTDIAEDLAPDVDVLSDSPERFAKASAPARSRALIASANEVRRIPQESAESAAEARTDTAARSRREGVAASPPPPPAPVLADAARVRDSTVAESDRGATESVAAAGTRGTTESVAAVEAENGKAAAPAAASAERDPKAWLQRIAKLRAEGKHAQADREFKAFVKRYPEYVTDEAAK